VDQPLLPISNELAFKQAQRTTAVINTASRALSYCAGKLNMTTTYYACDMILTVYVDASYLSRSMALSVVGCIFFLGKWHHICHLCVVSSAGEVNTLLYSRAVNMLLGSASS
jgi:hypothetical protein